MKRIIMYVLMLIIVSTLSISCGNSTRISAGIPTQIKSIAHTTNGDTYSIVTVSDRLGEQWEINLSQNLYRVNGKHFDTTSVGLKYFPIVWRKDWFLFEIGTGFRWSEVDHRNKWLYDSHIQADVSVNLGIRWETCSLIYSLQHLSVPWHDDRGLNFDMLTFEWRF